MKPPKGPRVRVKQAPVGVFLAVPEGEIVSHHDGRPWVRLDKPAQVFSTYSAGYVSIAGIVVDEDALEYLG